MDLHHSQNSKNLEYVMQHRGNWVFFVNLDIYLLFLTPLFFIIIIIFYFVWKKKLCIVCIFHNLDNCEMKGVFLTFLSPLPYEIQPSTRIRFHYFPSVKKKRS